MGSLGGLVDDEMAPNDVGALVHHVQRILQSFAILVENNGIPQFEDRQVVNGRIARWRP
jgi:hypothetical protein